MDQAKSKKLTGDIIISIIIAVIGVFFLIQANLAESSGEDAFGPGSVPIAVSIVLILLAILKIILSLKESGYRKRKLQEKANRNYQKLAAVAVLGFAYVVLFSALGYFVSTLIALSLILYIFEIRKLFRLILIALGGSFVYYMLFVGVMKIYDPPGEWINFQSLMPF